MVAKDIKLNGVLLLDKPSGITSHDAVQRVRKTIGQRRVGHTGTLDPLATGLLAVCLGKATKIARFISEMGKTYEAEIRLGRTSETFDSEGVNDESPETPVPSLTEAEIKAVLDEFVGVIKQTVPLYSAVRVDGKRLYDLARKGKTTETPERQIEIKQIVLQEFQSPYLRIQVSCSKGTYIRSLANDIGQRFGCGAYLSALKRTAIGHLDIGRAHTLERVEQFQSTGTLEEHLLDFDQVLDYAAILIRDECREYIESGRQLRESDVLGVEGDFHSGDKILLKVDNGSILAVGTAGVSSEAMTRSGDEDKLFNYLRVLN